MTQDSSQKKVGLFSTPMAYIAAGLSVLLPIFYAIGYFYDEGYFNTYGIGASFFLKDTPQYLVYAFIVFVKLLVAILDWIVNSIWSVLGLSACAYFTGMAIILMKNWEGRDRHINKLLEDVRKNTILYYLISPSIFVFKIVIVPIYLLVFLLLLCAIPFLSYQQGKTDAEKAQREFTSCKKTDCLVIAEKEKVLYQGLLVAQSASHIALYNGEQTRVYPLGDYIIYTQTAKGEAP